MKEGDLSLCDEISDEKLKQIKEGKLTAEGNIKNLILINPDSLITVKNKINFSICY